MAKYSQKTQEKGSQALTISFSNPENLWGNGG
jgi:hypothetical protein